MTPISLTLQTLYQDLVQAHLDRPPEALIGAPHLRENRERRYWYATIRAPGGAHRQIFIGPDNDDTRKKVEAWKDASASARDFRALAAEKTRALRAARLPALDMTTGKVLRALAQAGAFRLGAVLVGTHAFRLYNLELGVRVSAAATAITSDVDVASFEKLSVAVDDHTEPELPEVLGGLGLEPAPTLDAKHPTRWKLPGQDFTLDFLAPSFEDAEGPQRLEALGLWAQGLHFLNFLLRDPIPAVAIYREGVLVHIPTPERFAIHKLIVSGRRKGANRAKALKDVAQARALISAIAQMRPDDLRAVYEEARAQGPRWEESLDSVLKQNGDIRSLLEAR